MAAGDKKTLPVAERVIFRHSCYFQCISIYNFIIFLFQLSSLTVLLSTAGLSGVSWRQSHFAQIFHMIVPCHENPNHL